MSQVARMFGVHRQAVHKYVHSHPSACAAWEEARVQKRVDRPKQCIMCKRCFFATLEYFPRQAGRRLRSFCRECYKVAQRKYASTSCKKIQQYNHTRYVANRKTIIHRVHAWQSANPDKLRAISARRRARKVNAPVNNLTAAQWEAIKVHYKYRCVYCGKKPKRLTQDHLTPLSKGGGHTASNVVPACRSCNSQKHAGPPLTPVQPLLLVG